MTADIDLVTSGKARDDDSDFDLKRKVGSVGNSVVELSVLSVLSGGGIVNEDDLVGGNNRHRRSDFSSNTGGNLEVGGRSREGINSFSVLRVSLEKLSVEQVVVSDLKVQSDSIDVSKVNSEQLDSLGDRSSSIDEGDHRLVVVGNEIRGVGGALGGIDNDGSVVVVSRLIEDERSSVEVVRKNQLVRRGSSLLGSKSPSVLSRVSNSSEGKSAEVVSRSLSLPDSDFIDSSLEVAIFGGGRVLSDGEGLREKSSSSQTRSIPVSLHRISRETIRVVVDVEIGLVREGVVDIGILDGDRNMIPSVGLESNVGSKKESKLVAVTSGKKDNLSSRFETEEEVIRCISSGSF